MKYKTSISVFPHTLHYRLLDQLWNQIMSDRIHKQIRQQIFNTLQAHLDRQLTESIKTHTWIVLKHVNNL